MKKKYLFFDIDGTLVAGGYSASYIPDSVHEAIGKLKAAGHFMALATGRSYAMAVDFMKTLGFENMVHDGGYGLTLNNAYIATGLDCYMKQTHVYRADDTETVTPGYALLSLSAGTDVQLRGKKLAELYITADNLLNKAYQSHLSRLKYADMNVVTARRGVYNMGLNITFKIVVPIEF